MPTDHIPEEIFAKAERNLHVRSAGVSIFTGCLSMLFFVITGIAFVNWFLFTPQLREWLSSFGEYLGTLGQPILDRLSQIPGGFPAPLALMIGFSIVSSIIFGIVKAASGYINFGKYNANKKLIEKEARRMIRKEESGWNSFEKLLDEIQVGVSGMDEKAQRQFKKFRTWISMWKEIPDEPEKAKNKAKREDAAQTVRLSDEGELIYEDEATKQQQSRSMNG